MKKKQSVLLDSDTAIYGLLESLLQEVEQIPDVAEEKRSSTETETKTQIEVKFSEPEPITETENAQLTENMSQAAALPDWAEDVFSALIFDLEGIEMAVPLTSLNGIAVWNEEALPMPAQPDWHLGVIKYRDVNLVLVDTARLIMPEKVQQTADERRQQHGSHFLVLNDRYGLSCNGIKETLSLKPEQIRWRYQRPTRPWALGTLIERLSILLDTDALLNEIEQL